MSKQNKILIISDMVGYGKLGLSAVLPILSHMKYEVATLPTALVSNNFAYGKFDILDTTDYIRNTTKIWDELNLSFNALCLGFITNLDQAELIYSYASSLKAKHNAFIVLDPIMGDNGSLYNGVPASTIDCMKKLCSISDVIVPNMTEACFLAGIEPHKSMLSLEELELVINRLEALNTKSIVITSANIEGRSCTVIKENKNSECQFVEYEEIPISFSGTGDCFTSLVTGYTLKGKKLVDAVRYAMQTIENLIKINANTADIRNGIPIEQYFDEIKD